MNSLAQNMMYGAIICLVGIFFYTMRPSYRLNTHGIFLPSSTQQHAAVSPSDVQMIKTLPMHYQQVGHIRAQIHYSIGTTAELRALMPQIIQYIKNSAAANGANGVIITRAGEIPGPSPLDGIIVDATAIKSQ